MAVVVYGPAKLKICFVDESGDTQDLISSTCPIQPAFVLGGVIIDAARLPEITQDWIHLKQTFFPNLVSRGRPFLQWIKEEIKGADIRRGVRQASRRERRYALGFLDKFVALIEKHDGKIVGRVWVKGIGVHNNADSVYTYSVQSVLTGFQNYLESVDDVGILIADRRSYGLDHQVAYSIFTQKFKASGDAYSRVVEMPVFGDSRTHAGIQIADMLYSGLFYPMATHVYCSGNVNNVHVQPRHRTLVDRYGNRLSQLQHRFQVGNGRTQGGITVSDYLGRRHGGLLFR